MRGFYGCSLGLDGSDSDRRRAGEPALECGEVLAVREANLGPIIAEQDGVVCSVRDEGPGLSDEDQANCSIGGRNLPQAHGRRVFNRLRLAVAKELIGSLGGTIGVKAFWGRGHVSHFDCPLPGTAPWTGADIKK